MIHPRKPIWTEGLFMTPQHLQQCDSYHETLLHTRMRAALAYDWGVTDVKFDERALGAGQLKIVKCHGVFPDGTAFLVGDHGEDQVEPRPIEGHFPAALDALDVFLAVPNQRDNAANTALDPSQGRPGDPLPRRAGRRCPDLNTGRSEQSITWARSNMRLLFGTEPRDAFHTIRLAQLERDRTGAIVLKKSFVPSMLHIGASTVPDERAAPPPVRDGRQAEGPGRRPPHAHAPPRSTSRPRTWPSSGCCTPCNSFIPIVSHLIDHGDAHPEDLYVLLGSHHRRALHLLAGRRSDRSPEVQLPRARAGASSRCSSERLAMVAAVLADQYIIVPLEKREDGMYLGKFEDPTLPASTSSSSSAKGADEATLRERLPRLLKMASWTQIGYILNAAIPGVGRSGRVPAARRHPREARARLPARRSGWRLLERRPELWHDSHLSADRSPEGRASTHWGEDRQVAPGRATPFIAGTEPAARRAAKGQQQ